MSMTKQVTDIVRRLRRASSLDSDGTNTAVPSWRDEVIQRAYLTSPGWGEGVLIRQKLQRSRGTKLDMSLRVTRKLGLVGYSIERGYPKTGLAVVTITLLPLEMLENIAAAPVDYALIRLMESRLTGQNATATVYRVDSSPFRAGRVKRFSYVGRVVHQALDDGLRSNIVAIMHTGSNSYVDLAKKHLEDR